MGISYKSQYIKPFDVDIWEFSNFVVSWELSNILLLTDAEKVSYQYITNMHDMSFYMFVSY